jgi:hypothetical protein
MYETGQPVRNDAREHLLWLARLPAFQMVRNPPSEIEQGGELPVRASYGWHHVPEDVRNRDRAVERPLQTARQKIAGVLPPKMRRLTEVLALVGPDQLLSFCERVEIRGSRALDAGQVKRLRSAIERRLAATPQESDRKTIERLLGHIDPKVCQPPVGRLHPALVVGQPVAISATAAYLDGSIIGRPSAAGWPVIGHLGPQGIELNEPPPAKGFRYVKRLDGSGSSAD